MLHAPSIPAGRTPPRRDLVPDLAMALDPAELWPDPEACPDWPLPNAHANIIRSRAAAEAELSKLRSLLNRGEGTVVAPTPDQRADIVQRFFKPGTPLQAWQRIGIVNLAPAGPIAEGTATLMVEAAHVQGFIRKLAARDAAATARQRREKRDLLQHTVDTYEATKDRLTAELAAVAEGEARHLQRIEDEKAFARAAELRRALRDHEANFGRAQHDLASMSAA